MKSKFYLTCCLRVLSALDVIIHVSVMSWHVFCKLFCRVPLAADSIQDGKLPRKFFPNYETVQDFYTGDMNSVARAATTTDVAFIMYYAPWDAECMQSKWEFMKASELLQKEVLQKDEDSHSFGCTLCSTKLCSFTQPLKRLCKCCKNW